MSYSVNILFLLTILLSTNLWANDSYDLSAPSEKDKQAKTRGNWFAAMGMRYEKAQNDFNFTQGVKNQITPDDSVGLFGGELRLGRELAIGSKLSLILSIEGFYSRNNDESEVKPDDKTVDVAIQADSIKTKTMGFTGYAALGLLPFKIKQFTILPIIELGFGSGKFSKDAFYFYDDTVSIFEYYQEAYEQNYTLTKVGVGFNIIASSGIFSYFRFYSATYEFESSTGTRSESFQTSFANPSESSTARGSSSETIFTTSIGFGYRF